MNSTRQRFNAEWKQSKAAAEQRELSSKQARDYKIEIMDEAVELHVANMSLPDIHAHLLSEHKEDRYYKVIPTKFPAFSTAFYRFLRKMEGDQ